MDLWLITQKTIATSAPEAELYEILATTKHMIYLKGLCNDVHLPSKARVIFTDGLSSQQTLKRTSHQRYKFLNVKIKFVKELVVKGNLSVIFINRESNLADCLTKQLPKDDFQTWISNIFARFHRVHKKVARYAAENN